MPWHLYAKEWGIDDLIWVHCYDTKREAEADKRHHEETYPEDTHGWPCRYIISTDPPEPEPELEQCFSNTQVL
jgi:hypothetical protein